MNLSFRGRLWMAALMIFAWSTGFAQSDSLFIKNKRVINNTAGNNFMTDAQSYMQQLQLSYPNDTGEAGRVNNYSRWMGFMEGRVSNDAPAGQNRITVANQGLQRYLSNRGDYCPGSSSSYRGNWKNVGPFINTYGGYAISGRVDAVWVDPADASHILAGANAGGLWETHNEGQDWVNITDASQNAMPGTMGVTSIAVNPQNKNIIYLVTGISNGTNTSYGYSTGIIYSTNGGASWQQDTIINTMLDINGVGYNAASKIAYKPGTQELYLMFGNRVFWKQNTTVGWANITPAINTADVFNDMKFTNIIPRKLALCTTAQTHTAQLWVRDNNAAWSHLDITDNNLSAGDIINTNVGILCFSFSGTDSAYLNITTTQGAVLGITPLSSLNLILRHNFLNYYGTAFQYMEVSPVNSNIIYACDADGLSSFFRSTDNGVTTQSFSSSHPDARCLLLYKKPLLPALATCCTAAQMVVWIRLQELVRLAAFQVMAFVLPSFMVCLIVRRMKTLWRAARKTMLLFPI